MHALSISLYLFMMISQQTQVIFEPVTLEPGYSFKLPAHTREIYIPVAKSVTLNGLLFEKPGQKLLMIYFQGNARNLQNFLDNHSMVLAWGYNVLVTDYRSFGKSGGLLQGQDQLYADADRVYNYALQLGYAPDNIVLYGYSMGTSSAAYLASTQAAKAVILESAYSSIPEIDWVGNKAPLYELNTAEKATRIMVPTLLIHGVNDTVITVDHSKRIFNNLSTPHKNLILIEGGGHGDLRQRPEFQGIINDFVSRY